METEEVWGKMFTRNAGPKALLTIIRAVLIEDPVELGMVITDLEDRGLWIGGSGGLSSFGLKDNLREVISDYEASNIPIVGPKNS